MTIYTFPARTKAAFKFRATYLLFGILGHVIQSLNQIYYKYM